MWRGYGPKRLDLAMHLRVPSDYAQDSQHEGVTGGSNLDDCIIL